MWPLTQNAKVNDRALIENLTTDRIVWDSGKRDEVIEEKLEYLIKKVEITRIRFEEHLYLLGTEFIFEIY